METRGHRGERLELSGIEMHEGASRQTNRARLSWWVSNARLSEFLGAPRQLQHVHKLIEAKVEDVPAFFTRSQLAVPFSAIRCRGRQHALL